MDASFHTLFRRRERDRVSPKEVFAVAAIAFCLKHDDEFKRAFLCGFCGIKLPAHIPKIRIAADDHKWGDLVVNADDCSFICVLEFKIDSKVKPKQNPNSQSFEYALQISKSQDCWNCGEKRFIVVTKDEAVQKVNPNCSEQHNIQCDWKSWTDLNYVKATSNLASDLFDCLGDFGIQSFRERQLMNMKLADSAPKALKVVQVLRAVYKLLGGRLTIDKISDEGNEPDNWWIGVQVESKLTEKFTGWFGYQGSKGIKSNTQPAHPAVWFYCNSPSSDPKKIRKLLYANGFKPELEKHEAPSRDIELKRSVDDERGDLEWFKSVYKAVGAIKKTE
jgi:hypothetical protein